MKDDFMRKMKDKKKEEQLSRDHLSTVAEEGISQRSSAELPSNNEEDVVNLPLLEKIKIIDTLEADEKKVLLKLIDMAVSKKKLKDNLSNLIAS